MIRKPDTAAAVNSRKDWKKFGAVRDVPLGTIEPGVSEQVEARFEPHEEPRTIPVPNIIGTVYDEPSPGVAVFRLDGATHRLDVIGEPADGELFFVFGDETNGTTTYGGGRFLYAPVPDEQGRMVLDFNRAYSPPCAFTAFATCPLPPRGNDLPVAVEAGEKAYHGPGGHA